MLLLSPPIAYQDTCILGELDAADFPAYRISAYLRTAPQPGDLCHVRAENREFLGIYHPRRRGADFEAGRYFIRTRRYEILGVLHPLVFRLGLIS